MTVPARTVGFLSLIILMLFVRDAVAHEEAAARLMRQFVEHWSEADWGPRAPGYMRKDDDEGWKQRMLTLQQLVRLGEPAADEMQRVLREGSTPERILAAQVAGYAGLQACAGALVHAAEHDADAAVRLYAIDSLSWMGKGEHDDLFRRLLETEKNRDTKRHLTYALERAGAELEPGVTQQLLDWQPDSQDAARLGQPAPDFELMSLSGKTVRLSDYRGRSHVVLVFVYGDT